LAQRWSRQQISRHLRLNRTVGDVGVPREHLPGRLSTGIGVAAAISAGAAPSLPAAHRA
jgi:hypothetical protein